MLFFFLMIRRPPRSTLDRSSAASDVYKRQVFNQGDEFVQKITGNPNVDRPLQRIREFRNRPNPKAVSYTHLRAHETVLDLVCRLLLAKKNDYIERT